LFIGFSFFISKVTLLDQTIHREVEPVVETFNFVSQELLGNSIWTKKLLLLRTSGIEELQAKVSPNGFTFISFAQDSIESAFDKRLIVNLLGAHIDELVPIIKVGELLLGCSWTLNDIAEDRNSSWGKQPGNFFHELLGIGGVDHGVIAEDEIERGILELAHLVKALFKDLILGLGNLCLLCLGEVVDVLGLAQVHSDHDI